MVSEKPLLPGKFTIPNFIIFSFTLQTYIFFAIFTKKFLRFNKNVYHCFDLCVEKTMIVF